MTTAATPTPDSPTVTPFDPYVDIQVIPDADGATASVKVQTAEDTVLVTVGAKPSVSAAAYRVVEVPSSGDFVILGDVVRIEGALARQGWAMEINARVLEFGPDLKGVPPSIDASGRPPALPGTAPLKNPKRAADGADATYQYVFLANDHLTPSKVGVAGLAGTDGADGAIGNPAGWVDIRCGKAIAIGGATLTVNASGGAGGNGQPGGAGQDGGNGGSGYNGDYVGIADIVKPADGASAGAGGPGGRGGRPGPGGLGGVVRVFSMTALPAVEGVASIKTSNGLGPVGAKGARGADGRDGTPGSGGAGVQVKDMWIPDAHDGVGVGDTVDQPSRGPAAKGPKAQAAPTINPAATFAHMVTTISLDQLQMLCDRIQRDRLVLDSTSKDSMTAICGRIRWVQGMTTAYPDSSQSAPWLLSLRQTSSSLAQLLSNPSLDAFGHTSDWAPLASMAEYRALLGDGTTGSIGLLVKMEEEWSAYRAARDTALANTAQYNSASLRAGERLTQLHDQLTIAWKNLAGLTQQIDDLVDVVADAEQQVLDRIEDFKASVKYQVNLSFGQFLQVLSQAAFAPEAAATEIAVYGALGAEDNALTTVASDTGQSMPKTYLINKLDLYGETVKGLDEAYSAMNGQIQPDDPNAYKLLCTQQSLDNLLSNYTSVNGAKEAQAAMDDYVKQVLARNGKILAYNACASLIVQLHATRDQLTAQQAEAQNQAAGVVTPVLDTFVQALYDVAKLLCITDLYNLSRAYRFWSLDDVDLLGDVLRLASLADVDSAAVMTAQQQLLVHDVELINGMASKLQPQKDPVVVSFTADSHPHLLDALVKDRRKKSTDPELPRFCTFTLDPATADSTGTSSPFVGKVNVRLVEARCWLIGLSSAADQTGILKVHLTQGGDETIIASDAPHVPVSVSHDPVSSVFSYKVGVDAPSEAAIETPVTYWDPDVGDQTILHVPDLTPIGPFATWQIALRPEEISPQVDWTALTEIRLEFFVRFHGIAP